MALGAGEDSTSPTALLTRMVKSIWPQPDAINHHYYCLHILSPVPAKYFPIASQLYPLTCKPQFHLLKAPLLSFRNSTDFSPPDLPAHKFLGDALPLDESRSNT